ncbi:MAG: DUF3237 domain-containing protein [Alphaproteobacteria bacterium]|nr:DUF3237 domain-containing protein [Alphaproteobacteria bacterium]
MHIATKFLCDYRATLEPVQHDMGRAHAGRRLIAVVTGGDFKGERLNGRVLPGGGDWALIDDERDTLRLDARVTWETNDGAKIFVSYRGVLKPLSLLRRSNAERQALYFRTSPVFETGDVRYVWLNDLVCVAIGSVESNAVRYQVFEVE